MKFFETIMGRRFFEGQLPNLIKQLTRIADALEESNELKKRRQKIMARNNHLDDSPQFNALRNSNLVCANCIFKNEDDLSVATCVAYPNIKPTRILDGGQCDHHMTLEQAMEKYGDD